MPELGATTASTILVLALMELAGCQPAGSDGPERTSSDERTAIEADVPTTASDSLRLTLHVPDRVEAGEPVPMTVRLENASERALDLHLRGRTIAFDLVVTAEDGSVVWRRLEGEVIPAILRIETLPAGEALELEDTWDGRSNEGAPVPPGLYRVRGEVPAEGEPLVTPTERLRIVEGG